MYDDVTAHMARTAARIQFERVDALVSAAILGYRNGDDSGGAVAEHIGNEMGMDLYQRLLVQHLSSLVAGVIGQIEPEDPLGLWGRLVADMRSTL